MAQSAWEQVRSSIRPVDKLLTPGRGLQRRRQAAFDVVSVDPASLTIAVGKTAFEIRLPAAVFNAVVESLSSDVRTLRVAATHSRDPLPGSVDEVVREAAGWRLASGGYVAAILEHAGVVEYVMMGQQKHVRLPAGQQSDSAQT